jgi:hypothetical protein
MSNLTIKARTVGEKNIFLKKGGFRRIGWPYAQSAEPAIGVDEQEALAIGTEAYIYGYPLVIMEIRVGP